MGGISLVSKEFFQPCYFYGADIGLFIDLVSVWLGSGLLVEYIEGKYQIYAFPVMVFQISKADIVVMGATGVGLCVCAFLTAPSEGITLGQQFLGGLQGD